MVLDLNPCSDDRERVKDTENIPEGYTRRIPMLASERERGCLIIDQNGILKITSIDSAHLKHVVLGEGRLEKNNHG